MSTVFSPPDYQHIFRSLPGCCLLLTPDGTVVECSVGFATATGQLRETVVGHDLAAAWSTAPTLVPHLTDSLAHVQANRQPHTIRHNAPGAPLLLTQSPILNAQGELLFILHTAEPAPLASNDSTNSNDSSALHKLQQELNTANQELQQALSEANTQRKRLHSLFMQAPAAIATLRGPKHVFEMVNPGYQQLVGNRPLVGKTIREGLPELEDQGFFELLDSVYQTGQTYYGKDTVAYLDRHNTGRVSPYHFDFIYQAILDTAGQIEGILVFAYDVSERVSSREKMEHSELELQTANEELATINEELHASNEEFHANNAELSSTQQELRSLNLELESRVKARTLELDLTRQEAEQQRARLERFFMQAPAAICVLDGPNLVFELVNPGYQHMFPGRVLLGKPILEALPEIAGHPMWQTLREVYRTGVTHEEKGIMLSIVRTAGSPPEDLYFNYIQQARFDARGRIDGILVFAYEVTEQVRAQQREAHAARAFETMTNAVPHQVWTGTPNGDMNYYNQQWYDYTGSTFEEVKGQGWQQYCHPEDLPRQRKQWLRAVHSGQPYQTEARLRNREGVFRWFLIRAQPSYNDQGVVVKWFGSNTDIHEQKRLEQTLLESEQYFRAMADNVPAMIWVTRPDGQCVYLNQQWYEYTGQTEQEALGFGWTNAIHPDESEQAGQAFRDANDRHETYSMVYRLQTNTNLYRWVVDTGKPKFSATGEYQGFVGSVVDIHERKMAEQALRLASQRLATTNKELRAAHQRSQQANAELALTNEQLTRINQDLDNFVYTASHDLRQPVNNMAGVFEELKRSATFHDPEAEQLVQMFEGALHQIHTTIQGLAEVVHVERRNEQFPLEPVELLPLTNGVIQSMKSQVAALKAEFELDFKALPTVHFAQLNLQSILYNLLSNALKYAHPDRKPVVRVSSEVAPDGSPVLVVQDNGLGLDMERYGSDLFKMFRRFHDHVTGSGMGLYLVNRIVRQGGGHIEVDSTVGVGTTFRIFLPKE
ncbi:PAS domain-containing protein [Hymenobacter tibetensis]|uniref:histidine kinase n=1 Tax=Hymenobacter tibetensis TaxID=497967 RepID=A0ABY4CT70_9BACT|nr:PAS domain S-box protein [Hymenobacter tibetensis]UOG73237.1 PAS domain-containing protein [Hymenobacter tibetensis]